MWKVEEYVDLLVLYKNMLLSGIKKNNFKELSKRMDELGWERNNDQCLQQVNYLVNLFLLNVRFLSNPGEVITQILIIQIYLLQDHYDKMNDAGTKTGGVLYFEPLRAELHDCFSAIKNVQPDSVFSSQQGIIVHTPPDEAGDNSNDTESNEGANSTQDNEQPKSQRERKSMIFIS